MSNRLRPTLTDYVVIAINPALIMLLITSLTFFLLELFYQGQYPERLHFCLWWFIFGIVLVSRISMEEGWDRAAPFGAALAIVVALALNKFVDYRGTNLAEVGWMINYALMALIWWCAHQLTWDCTLMDETQDASGEGLLQTAGLDSRPQESQPDPSVPQPVAPTDDLKANELFAVAIAGKGTAGGRSLWRKFILRRRRPHAPGVWVVYFSLAALPMFGVGQAFIPIAKVESRRYAFVLLCLYVACALGLLLTTSFLALRRYLRQRRLEMPLPMAGTWLVMGAILIGSLLFLTTLLPRPNAEYDVSELLAATSTEQASSQTAAGKEGTKDDKSETGSGQRSDHSKNDEQESKSSGNQPSKTANTETPTKGESENRASEKGTNAADSNAKGGESSSKTASRSSEQPSQQTQQAQQSQSAQPTEPSGKLPMEINPPSILNESFVTRVKWLFYGALVLFGVWGAWRYREELFAWLQDLLAGWRGLFSQRSETAGAKNPSVRQKSFFEYPDPFANGTFEQYSPEELVRYSFEAFEAWGRDHGWPRGAEQTAHEFARQIGAHVEYLAQPARALADLYSRAAYAPGTLHASSLEYLRSFWRALPQSLQVPAESAR